MKELIEKLEKLVNGTKSIIYNEDLLIISEAIQALSQSEWISVEDRLPKDIPSPYKWLKEEKWKIPQGATYYEPKVTLTQCAGWITEYIKKYYFKTL